MAPKKELLNELDAVCKPETIFASNTSSLSIIADKTLKNIRDTRTRLSRMGADAIPKPVAQDTPGA